jgi:hypothetical protein
VCDTFGNIGIFGREQILLIARIAGLFARYKDQRCEE